MFLHSRVLNVREAEGSVGESLTREAYEHGIEVLLWHFWAAASGG